MKANACTTQNVSLPRQGLDKSAEVNLRSFFVVTRSDNQSACGGRGADCSSVSRFWDTARPSLTVFCPTHMNGDVNTVEPLRKNAVNNGQYV